ncbi:MAG TPA: guanylate kinase [Acetivibrio sp.]|uniref:guanylate kinase n=1 Tax=Acetivibrio sp. TaxID=1872092 RepID=UPI002BD11B00|nr:guanylate kinase [Acetivibrio sp.]HOM02454.1 guanylate kinase [Acetivibrio sp.]
MYREGLLVVISGPSGAGKGTLLNLLRDLGGDSIRFSVSATTRKPRKGEVDGVNYFFKTKEEFKLMIENDELFEWVEYCDNFYGTPKKYVEDSVKEGYDCFLEIEVEGAAKVMKAYPECVSVFILPPSFEELRRRIEKRGTEDVEVVNKRLDRAREEIAYASNYDYIIVNDDLKDAVENLRCIIRAEKLKSGRNREFLHQFQQA